MISHAKPQWMLRAVCLVAGGCLFGVEAHGQAQEYELKAAFIFNFTRFVSWPDAAQAISTESRDNSGDFVIGVLGNDPFDGNLEAIVRGELVGNRPIRIERLADTADALRCDMVFIPRAESGKLEQVLSRTRGLPILTVGDGEEMIASGCVIGFERSGKKVKLIANVDAARDAGLRISSKLLRLCEIANG